MTDINFGNPFSSGTAEELEAAAESKFTAPPAAAVEGAEPHAAPSTEQELDQVIEESIPPFSLPDEFDLGGRPTSRAEVEAWANFDRLLKSDPRLADTIYNYLHGSPSVRVGGAAETGGAGASTPPAPQPGWGNPPVNQPAPQSVSPSPTIPQIDPELLQDPAVAFLYSQIQEQSRTLDNYRQEISRLGAITSSRVEAESKSIIETAVDEFKTNYGVDDAVAQRVRMAAARLEVIPSVLRGIDPITGQPTDPNPLNAVRRAMEIAAYSDPDVRQQIIESQLQVQQADELRKRRLNAVGGSSRTVPRNAPAPTNSQDRYAAMVSEVAAAMHAANGQE